MFEPIRAESINELESWFDDAAARRHLGDRSWLVRALRNPLRKFLRLTPSGARTASKQRAAFQVAR